MTEHCLLPRRKDSTTRIGQTDKVITKSRIKIICNISIETIHFASFASGVGARSATVGYGLNRADCSYIPVGVVSGTALIRLDFPELLELPYL